MPVEMATLVKMVIVVLRYSSKFISPKSIDDIFPELSSSFFSPSLMQGPIGVHGEKGIRGSPGEPVRSNYA